MEIMSNYKDLATTSSIFSISFALIVGNYAKNWLDNVVYGGQNGELPVLFIVLCIIITISQISDIAIKQLIKRLKILRQLLLGRQFLEGTWIDRVKYKEETIGYGIIVVSSDLDFIYLNGQDFSKNFEFQYSFEGHTNIIEWPKITVVFSGGHFSPSLQEIMIINILENGETKPNHWTAVFSSQSHRKYENIMHGSQIYYTEAWKVTDKSKINDLHSPNRESILKNLANEYFKDCKSANQTHLSDF